MRTFIIALLFCVVSRPLAAQLRSYYNFEIFDNDIVYSQVFTQDSTDEKTLRQQLLYTLRNFPFIRNVETFEDGVIAADIIDYRLDYKKYGYTLVQTPLEIYKGLWTAKALISFKDNKYRVVVQSLSYNSTPASTTTYTGGDLLSTLAFTSKRDGFRAGILSVLEFLNKGFSNIFTIQTTVSSNDNW